jgi:hypothetical protein
MKNRYAPYEKSPFDNLGFGPSLTNKKKKNQSAIEGREDLENHVLTDDESSTEDVLQMMQHGQL